jgi:rhodanese-related sulfurtransferase
MSQASDSPTPIEVDVQTVQKWLKNRDDRDELVLIDCREDEEFAAASIEGAVLMPMSRWQDEMSKLKDWPDKHLVVYCHHGRRSLQVVSWLRKNGFPNAQSMQGGIDAWSIEIDPQVARY